MTIELTDPNTALLSGDGAILQVPNALARTWDLPMGSHTSTGIYLPFPAHILAHALDILASRRSPSCQSLDAESVRSLIALEGYGVPVLAALVDLPLPEGMSYMLAAVYSTMGDKTTGVRRPRVLPLPPAALPAWCRVVLEERAPHAVRALDS
ncbi:hypothetical protein CspeluHIS016_0403100 [Cutaneotrichosporon spelunceum]|uniref:Uncharacterized protein n=1 Tax=Cutaneotrichosporon spelunceum TaxID=1672016 RepID=A0AAD3TV36_9TREE|nr:hypothetical protein CspeluHIS016_0403100 [Cutaneotrichosporon spelunceum]